MGPDGVTVLHVLPHVQTIGNGIVDVTIDLAVAQAEQGMRVTVASAGGEYEELLAAHGVACAAVPLTGRGLPALRRLIRSVRPDVVHTHTLKGLALARAAAPRSPVLNTSHRDLGRYSHAMRLATRVLAVSDGIAEILRPYVPEGRIRVVRNGVLGGPRRASVQALPAAELARPAVVFVGGIYERKGVGVLLEAWSRLVHADGGVPGTLHVVGNGPDRERYTRLAQELGIADRVEWAGFRPDAHAFIKAADVFVLPSLSETFGLVLAEAREAGVAILGAATGGVPEVLEHGAAGVLVPTGDVEALATALRRLLDDPEERARLRTAARTGLEWLTVDRMADEVGEQYRELLGRR